MRSDLWASRAFQTPVLVGSSGLSAVAPLVILTEGVRLGGIPQGAQIAMILSVSAYFAQVLGAVEVESRVPATVRLRLPRSLWVLGFGPALAILATLWDAHLLAYGFIAAGLVPLECSRSVSIMFGRVKAECIASVVLASFLGIGFLTGRQGIAISLTSLGIIGALMVRFVDQTGGIMGVRRRGWQWLLADVGVAGLVQPVSVILVQAALAPKTTVALRTVTSVVGVMAPVLATVRLRLLNARVGRDVVSGLAMCLAIGVGIVLLDEVGVLNRLLGRAWSGVSVGALTIAIAWRLATLITVSPFAELRRAGRFSAVFLLRCISTAVFLLGSLVGAAVVGSLTTVFTGFLVAELCSAFLFTLTSRRFVSRKGFACEWR